MRTPVAVIAAITLIALAGRAHAQWGPNGVLLSAPPAAAGIPLICSDGAGGAYVGWRDSREYSILDSDVYAQRVLSNGAIAPGWPASGAAVCRFAEYQGIVRVAPDGMGGVFVVWEDARNARTLGTGSDLYFQRLTPQGSRAAGWQEHGSPVVIALGYESSATVAADGLGGALVAWADNRNSPSNSDNDIYALHFSGAGVLGPGWDPNGLRLTPLAAYQGLPRALTDGAGGFIVSWIDRRTGGDGAYAQRLNTSGETLWSPDGNPAYLGPYFQRDAISDGSGGIYIGSGSLAPPPWVGGEGTLVLHRMTGSGVPAPGWPAGGALVCEAPEVRQGFRMTPDGLGGALMVWSDYRNYFTEDTASDLYALRILADGTRAPGWPANGVRVTAGLGFEEEPAIVGDGQGGCYLSWHFFFQEGSYVFVQHLTASGEVAPGWPEGGRPVLDQPVFEDAPGITTDGAGGCIVSWRGDGIRARRFAADGPVAAAIALTSAVVEDGVVRLAWHGGGAAHLAATIERRAESSAWQSLADITADASGRFLHEDRSVEPGTRYAYRLRWRESDGEHTTNESWVSVPARLSLALEGLRPNPAARDLTAWFTLPARAAGRIELLDIAGRVRRAIELSSHGAGRQAVRLGDAGEFEPGVYWIRLVHGGEQRLTRGVLIR